MKTLSLILCLAAACAAAPARAETVTFDAPLNGWRVLSAGAYFAYVAHPFASLKAAEVAQRLAEERGVLALPGPYFGPGQEEHLRIAIANVAADRIGLLGERLTGFAL